MTILETFSPKHGTKEYQMVAEITNDLRHAFNEAAAFHLLQQLTTLNMPTLVDSLNQKLESQNRHRVKKAVQLLELIKTNYPGLLDSYEIRAPRRAPTTTQSAPAPVPAPRHNPVLSYETYRPKGPDGHPVYIGDSGLRLGDLPSFNASPAQSSHSYGHPAPFGAASSTSHQAPAPAPILNPLVTTDAPPPYSEY